MGQKKLSEGYPGVLYLRLLMHETDARAPAHVEYLRIIGPDFSRSSTGRSLADEGQFYPSIRVARATLPDTRLTPASSLAQVKTITRLTR